MQNLDSGFWILDCLVQNPNSRVQVLLSTKTKVQVLNHPKTRIQSPVSTDKADNTVVSVIMMLRCPWSLAMLDVVLFRSPYSVLFYSIILEGRRGTMDEFAAIPFQSRSPGISEKQTVLDFHISLIQLGIITK